MKKAKTGFRLDPEFRAYVLEKRKEGLTGNQVYEHALKMFTNLPKGYVNLKRIKDLIYHEEHKEEAKKRVTLNRRQSKGEETQVKPSGKATRGRVSTLDMLAPDKKDEILNEVKSLRENGFNWSSAVEQVRADYPDVRIPSAGTFQRLFRTAKTPKRERYSVSVTGLGIEIRELEIPRGVAIDLIKIILERTEL